jgi:hypothetical protein
LGHFHDASTELDQHSSSRKDRIGEDLHHESTYNSYQDSKENALSPSTMQELASHRIAYQSTDKAQRSDQSKSMIRNHLVVPIELRRE